MRNLLITIITILAVYCSASGKERCTVRIMSTDGTRPVELAIYDSKSDLRNSNLRTRLLDGDTIINLEADEIIKYSVTDVGEMLEKGGTRRFGDFFVENGALVDIRLSAEGISVSSTGKEDTAWRGMEAEMKEVFADDLAYLRSKGDNLTEEEADSLSRKMYDWQYDYCQRKPMLGFLLDLDESLSNYSFTDTEIKNKVDVYKRSYLNFRPDHSSHRSIAANLEKGYQMKGGKYNDFTARNADGDTVRASEFFRDRVTMVICWATWCLPCRKDALDAVPVFEKYKDRGLVAFSLAHEFNSPDEFRKAIAEDKLPWPSLYDLDDEFGVFEKHGTSNAAFFLVDRDGTIVATAYSAEELEPAIVALLPE